MKNLTRHRLALGVLMAFVLAFGVQGIADALTFGTTRTNDLQTIVRGGTFSVTFAVTTVDTSALKTAYTGYIVDPNDSTRYFSDTNGDGNYDSGEPTVSTTNAFHYNNEAVRISVSGAGAKITSIGANTIAPGTSITLREGGSGAEALTTGDVVVNCSTSSHGEVTITASDVTPGEDYPSGVRKAPNFVLTTYVTQYNQAVGPTRTIRLVGVTNGVAIGYDNQRNQPIYNGDSSHYPVTYTVTGGGMVQIQEGTRLNTAAATLSTSTAAKVLLSMEGVTNTVTAQLGGSFESSQGIYIYGNPQLNITGGNNQSGDPNTTLATALQVTLTDNAATATGVAGVPIKFDVTDTSPSGGILSQVTGTTIVDASNEVVDSPIPGSTMYVRTNASGAASITFQLGTLPGQQTITAGALNIARLTQTIRATATGTAATRQLFVDDIDRQGSTNIYTLVARVENGGQPDADETVTFTTTKGLLTGRNADDDSSLTAKTVYMVTNAAGKARVTYNAGDASGILEVVGSISVATGNSITQLQEVTFNVRGGSSNNQQNNQQDNQQQDFDAPPDTLVKDDGDNQRGEPGETLSEPFVVQLLDTDNEPINDIEVTFTVLSGGGSLSDSTDTTNSSGRAETTLTLGSSGSNTVRASVDYPGVSSVTFTATAERVSVANRLVIESGNNQTGELNSVLAEDLTVRLLGTDGSGIQSITIDFEVTEGNGVISRRNNGRTDEEGYASARFSPRSTGDIEVEASVRGIDTISPVTFSITGGSPPDALVLVSGNNQSGKPGERLSNPFVVEVIDEDDEPVSGVTVTFAVTAGGGTLSTTSTTTNGTGRAQTYLRLGEAIGDNTVVARVSGLTDRVTFRAKTGAQVLVNAAARPPMYWVGSTNGTLHRLVDAEVEDLATSAEGAMSIAIDSANGYLYWTAQTGNNKGVIRRAGLNGRGVQTLKTVSVMPTGIAIDAAGGMVYWTNARGNILSMPAAGGKVTNVLRNLSSPGPIALSNGVLYWGEAAGSVRKMSVTAKPKTPVNLATGLGEPLAIVIAKGKVYWIERGGGGSGKLQRVNTNGQNIQQLKSFASGVPIGLTADSSENKLYWTKRTGKIQRSNFAGRFVKDIVTGLPNPGSIALSVETVTTTPAAQGNQQTTTQQTNNQQTQQTSDTSKYDVNGDGAVNQADIDQVVQAVAFKSGDMKYDLNGDGSVDANDITAIVTAVNATDAAAPSVLITDIDVTLLDVTVLHEQIAVLLASGDRSIAAQRTLAYLQQLLTMARPDETVLLANYPNPFNPETWIPYQLAESTDVRVNIYDAQGTLVRELTLGHQTAGYYTSRSRAAYWDGRNALGERVASGIYFYQLQTDAISSMRKMVILK